jgi:hypothetical protein
VANYNPLAPLVIGDEWVAIRNEDLTFATKTNVVEYGHGFTLATSRTLSDGRFYVKEPGSDFASEQTVVMSVYPRGTADQTGPIKSVIIPCNDGGITGIVGNPGNPSLSGASTFADAVSNASDGKYINSDLNSGVPGFQLLGMRFNVDAYAQLLNGKRILEVRLRYVADGANFSNDTGLPTGINVTPTITYDIDNGAGGIYSDGFENLELTPYPIHGGLTEYATRSFGEVTAFWTTQAPNIQKFPWRLTDLLRLSPTFSGTRLSVILTTTSGNLEGGQTWRLKYAALEVIYCEEKRVAIGAVTAGTNWPLNGFQQGMNSVPLRTNQGYALNPVLAAGEYDVTVTVADPGEGADTLQGFTFATLNAVRELYPISTIPSLRVDVTRTPGQVFGSSYTPVLPQLSLHASGGTLTEPHVYGRQGAAQVFGTVTARQVIDATNVTASTPFPQARFYARRYGDTTIPLTLTGASQSLTLTPDEWDDLPEIVDRWKEVTKRFTSAPLMGGGTTNWDFTATSETAGNRWEVLVDVAPAISGAGFTLVPSPNQLGTATYAGTTGQLSWMPNGISAGPVSGTTADPASDAVLLFSQDPNAITGFAVTGMTQELAGFAECGSGPCCIPTGLAYNRITWSLSSIVVTGFGAYELQRYDPTGAEWQTIMLATDRATTGFNDYEARVGVQSRYQMRQFNARDFAGPWSITGSVTTSEPGVTMPSCGTEKRGVLIFTSNEVQDGSSNLAYAMTWEDSVAETFSFPEAGSVSVERFYDRDFQSSFHGTERGGEQFSRTLLIANAAVSPPRLANMRDIRDLGWADIQYVCVRDDIGDRWLAIIVVPEGTVRRNRRLYNVNVSIVESTATPTQVDP